MTRTLLILCLVAAAGSAGCESSPPAPGPIAVGAGDVVSSPRQPAENTGAAMTPDATASDEPRYTLDGLIGQVNGRPIYARTILEPMHEQLVQIARQHQGRAFREQVVAAVTLRVNEVLQNALILGEAERSLSQQEQQGLAHYLEEHRQELLRLHGRGSVAVAEQTLREERGISLADAIEEYRVRLVVQRYLGEKLLPQINVTRRDIERYYREHPETFNPPVRRTVRLIHVLTEHDAQIVIDALASADADFALLASQDFNRFKPADAGLMEIVGDAALAVPALNDRLRTLDVGEHAGPFVAVNGGRWFVYLEAMEKPPTRSLKDAQLDIEATLRKRQFDLLRERFMQRLYQDGSYTPVEEMIARLYAIAEARYRPPAAAR